MLAPRALDAAAPDSWPAAPGSCVAAFVANMCEFGREGRGMLACFACAACFACCVEGGRGRERVLLA